MDDTCGIKEDPVGCIVGAVVQVKPNMAALVRKQLDEYATLEIHAEDAQLRWVITLEAETSKKLLKLSEDIQNIHGVLSLTPVYQHDGEHQQQNQQGGWTWR